MLRRWMLVLTVSACGFPSSVNVGRVSGSVRGLWDGNAGVVLRLASDGVDRVQTITTDGAFEFPDVLDNGTLFVVSIDSSPTGHTCTIATGAQGTLETTPPLDIACMGPAVALTLSTPIPWTFDPTQDQQSLDLSVLTQAVAITVASPDGSVTAAQINGVAATLGVATPPTSLPLGPTAFSISLQAAGGLSKTYQLALDRGTRSIEQAAFVKASNTHAQAIFGDEAFSFDGDTLAVGAYGESSKATGVDGDQADQSSPGAGAVYVFRRTGAVWHQEAYLKASNTDAGDNFGWSVSVSGDVLAVGAPIESSNATGVNPPGGQANNGAAGAGAVYIFRRTGVTWAQEAYVKASNTSAADDFGFSVSLVGSLLAVGADEQAGGTTDEADRSLPGAGAVYLFQFGFPDATTWAQLQYLKASTPSKPQMNANFGQQVSLSGLTAVRSTLAITAPGESIGGPHGPIVLGGAYVFAAEHFGAFDEEAHLTGVSASQLFASSVAVSGDTLVIGAEFETTDDGVTALAGAAYLYERNSDGVWQQQAKLRASNTRQCFAFGFAVAIGDDVIAVGAWGETSDSTGVNQPPGGGIDGLAPNSGAAYVFSRDNGAWTQHAYLKASNTQTLENFGHSLAFSNGTLAVGALDASAAMGVNPPNGQSDTSAPEAGALYIFR